MSLWFLRGVPFQERLNPGGKVVRPGRRQACHADRGVELEQARSRPGHAGRRRARGASRTARRCGAVEEGVATLKRAENIR